MTKPHMQLSNGDIIHESEYAVTSGDVKIGPLYFHKGFLWNDSDVNSPNVGSWYWTSDGKSGMYAAEDCPDLVAKWQPLEIPNCVVDLPNGKKFDATNPYCVQFNLMDSVYGDGAQEAMKSHGGPYETWFDDGEWVDIFEPAFLDFNIYRVKFVPTINTVVQIPRRTKSVYSSEYIGDDNRSVVLSITLVDGADENILKTLCEKQDFIDNLILSNWKDIV